MNLTRWIFALLCIVVIIVIATMPRSRPMVGQSDASTHNVTSDTGKSRPKMEKRTSSPAAKRSQDESMDLKRAEMVESRVKDAYQEIFKWVKEGEMYLDNLDKAGVPEIFRWRAFLTLHTYCLLFDEHEFDVRSLNSQLLEAYNSDLDVLSNGSESRESRIQNLKNKIDTVQLDYALLKRGAVADLRRFHPGISDADFEVLFRFRPERIPLALPRLNVEEVYLGL